MRRRSCRVRVSAVVVSISVCVLCRPPSLRAAEFARGDGNGDGAIDLSDAIFVLGFLFLGTPAPKCSPIADGNADGIVDIADPIFVLGFLFSGTAAPPPLSPDELNDCQGIDPAAIARGRQVYEAPAQESFRKFACSTCHPASADLGDQVYPGSSLHDALARPSFKAGQVSTFLDAANTCRVHWMTSDPFTAEDSSFKDLVAFLQSLTPPGPAPAIVYTIGTPSEASTTDGSADLGCMLYHRSCYRCHGRDGVGTTRAPAVFRDPAFDQLTADFVRKKARRSGPTDSVYPDLNGGFMPFWSLESMSDTDLEDIVAYIVNRPIVTCSDGR